MPVAKKDSIYFGVPKFFVADALKIHLFSFVQGYTIGKGESCIKEAVQAFIKSEHIEMEVDSGMSIYYRMLDDKKLLKMAFQR